MIDIQTAYEIAKKDFMRTNNSDEYKDYIWGLSDCVDFGNEYGFAFQPTNKDKLYGNGFICVNKDTGKISYYQIHFDFNKIKRAKDIDINTIIQTA